MASTTDDKRLTAVESAKKTAVNNANKTYDSMINGTDAKYNELIQASKDWGTKQQQIQQANTDFAIEKINQQKDQTKKDYLKEQTGAYTDYQKATDQYGVGAEKQASAGLQNTGYAESSKVQAFTAYQNRYTTARETYQNAVLNYDMAIKDAQLKNNAALAEIAYKALQTQLEYALEGFQYKNTLLQTKLDTQIKLDSEYHNRYQDVLQQINTENALAEQIRQFNEQQALQKQKMQEEIRQYNETMAYQKSRDAVEDAQWEKQYALSKASASSSGGGSSSRSVSSGGSKSYSSSSSSSKKKSSSSGSSSSKLTSSSKSSSSTKKSTTPVGATSSSSSVKSGGKTWYTLSGKNFGKLGVSGAPSQKTIDKLVSSGKLKAKVINGKMYYRKG